MRILPTTHPFSFSSSLQLYKEKYMKEMRRTRKRVCWMEGGREAGRKEGRGGCFCVFCCCSLPSFSLFFTHFQSSVLLGFCFFSLELTSPSICHTSPSLPPSLPPSLIRKPTPLLPPVIHPRRRWLPPHPSLPPSLPPSLLRQPRSYLGCLSFGLLELLLLLLRLLLLLLLLLRRCSSSFPPSFPPSKSKRLLL